MELQIYSVGVVINWHISEIDISISERRWPEHGMENKLACARNWL
jgi:hypothetical protein